MKVSVTFEDNLYPLDISEDLELENLKALLAFESGIQASDLSVYYNGNVMKDLKKTLKDYGVKEGEMLVMIRRMASRSPQPPSFSAGKSITCLLLFHLIHYCPMLIP